MSQEAGTEAAGGAETSRPAGSAVAPVDAPAVTLRTIGLVRWGIALWVLALVALAFVPSLRDGDRQWWVWVPVAGIVLGGIGHVYLARGRGNAADA